MTTLTHTLTDSATMLRRNLRHQQRYPSITVMLIGEERDRYVMIPGSMSPDRVPITRPSTGVKPMEVSTDRPLRIAVAEQPLPRWSVTALICSCPLPISSA